MGPTDWVKATQDLPTKAAKIRALDGLGVSRADIARFLNIRYQHVRNVLTGDKPAEKTMPTTLAGKTAGFAREDGQVRMAADGSIIISPGLARQIVEPGRELVATIEDGGLWVATRDAAVKRAQALVRRYIPAGIDLVDELIAERRREAAGEL